MISSHILPELAEMCTEIGIIDKGKIVAQGSVNEIMKHISKERIIYAKPLSDVDALVTILREQVNVKEVYINSEDIEFEYSGNGEELSDILSSIISSGIKLLAFKEKEGNLEEIFMTLTGGGENA